MPLAVQAASENGAKAKSTASLDTNRIGSVSDEEKQLLRVEWTAARTRDAESKILDDIMGRLGRIEATAHELRQVIESFPDKQTVTPATCAPAAPIAATIPEDRSTTPAVESKPLEPQPATVTPVAPAPHKTPTPEIGDDDEHSELPKELIAAPALVGLALLAWLARHMLQRRRAKLSSGTNSADESGQALRAEGIEHHSLPPWDALHNTVPVTASPRTAGILADLGVPEMSGDASSDMPAPSADHLAAQSQTVIGAKTALVSTPSTASNVPVEFDSTLELAEIMLSMGMASGAAQALVQRIQENPREALAHWLKLLDIYRKDGHRSDFERAAKELQLNFNIRASDWMSADGNTPSLENFNRVIEHVVGLWSQPAECIDYLTRLLEDNREGMRNGFPQPVAEEMMMLISILRETSRQ